MNIPASPRWIDTADVAVLVRAALKETYPSVKFSVRTERYSGGSSLRVAWTDGPTQTQADQQVLRGFAGASFDGMIDLQTYHESTFKGERVRFGSDYVSGSRRESFDLMAKVFALCKAKYAMPSSTPAPVPPVGKYGQMWDWSRLNRDEQDAINKVQSFAYCYDATSGQMWDSIARALVPISEWHRWGRR